MSSCKYSPPRERNRIISVPDSQVIDGIVPLSPLLDVAVTPCQPVNQRDVETHELHLHLLEGAYGDEEVEIFCGQVLELVGRQKADLRALELVSDLGEVLERSEPEESQLREDPSKESLRNEESRWGI